MKSGPEKKSMEKLKTANTTARVQEILKAVYIANAKTLKHTPDCYCLFLIVFVIVILRSDIASDIYIHELICEILHVMLKTYRMFGPLQS